MILQAILTRCPGTILVEAWGEQSLFYNPGRRLKHGVYVATIKQKDGAHDRASNLDRAGVFRLNVGTSKPMFLERFGPPPPRPGKGHVIDGPWDFTQLDRIMPHPVYGWMSWVAVLSPSRQRLEEMTPLIDAAYDKARSTFVKKTGSKPS
jgi:hypothetical protein